MYSVIRCDAASLCCIFTGLHGTNILAQTTRTYSAAFTAGTTANKLRQAKVYIMYMLAYGLDYKKPSDTATLLIYIQVLANSYKNITTIKNYISGAKTYVHNMGGDVMVFSLHEVSNMIKGVARLSDHVPTQAPPLSVGTLRPCATFSSPWGGGGPALVARTAVLIGFHTMLQQSNLLPAACGPTTHTVRRRDVRRQGKLLWLDIMSSKTITDPGDRVSIPVMFTGGKYCPVRAWEDYVQVVPLAPSRPAFMLDETTLLTPRRLITYLRTALHLIGHPAATYVTVHSLRRSGAQAAARAGVSESDIMAHSTWKSGALYAYTPKQLYTQVPTTLASLFGR